MNATPRTIICTVGTSIANGCPSIRSYYQRNSNWDEDVAPLLAEINERLDGLLGSATGLHQASAEIHSLHRLGCGPTDEVVLLTSDTAEGRACLEATERTLAKVFNPSKIQTHRVVGLQSSDGERMKKEGIPNLLNQILPYLRDPQRRYGSELILNPTGGFKGIVPFTTVLGMLYSVRVIYLFEFSSDLINLPPLPVTLDLELFERARVALDWAQNEAVFAASKFFSLIAGFEPAEDDLFAGFLEREPDGIATLSPLATALLEEDREKAGYIMVSKKARAWLDSLPDHERQRMEDLACRLSSALCRRNQRKTFHGTDLEVYGRSRFAARFAGFTDGGVFHLCLGEKVTNHDDYERKFANLCRSDFAGPGNFERLEAVCDSSPELEDAGEALESWAELKRQRDQLVKELAALKVAKA